MQTDEYYLHFACHSFSPLLKPCSHAGRGGSSNAKVSVCRKACADMVLLEMKRGVSDNLFSR